MSETIIKAGTKVKVIDAGEVYSEYIQYIANITHFLDKKDLAKFTYGKAPVKGNVYTVAYVGIHPDLGKPLLVIVDDESLFIMGVDGVESSEKSFQEGCKVRINDDGRIYSTYSDFILAHREALRSKSLGRRDRYLFNYAYEGHPTTEEKKGTFTIILKDKHPESWAENRTLCIIESDATSRVFLIDESGLSEVD